MGALSQTSDSNARWRVIKLCGPMCIRDHEHCCCRIRPVIREDAEPIPGYHCRLCHDHKGEEWDEVLRAVKTR